MTAIIHCSATFEDPACFEGAHVYSIAVNLGFDWREFDGPLDQKKGKQWFKEFFADLPRVMFRLFYPEPRSDEDPAIVLKPMPGLGADFSVEILGNAAGDNLATFEKWLELRAENHWTTAQPPVDGTADVSALNATSLVKSAATWASPIPQDLGIVRILRVKMTKPMYREPFVVIPFFAEQPDQYLTLRLPPHETQEPGAYEYQYDAGSLFNAVVGVTNSLNPAGQQPMGLIDPQSGFLIPSAEADAIYRVIRKIEDKSGSLLWTFPPLLTIDWKEVPNNDGKDSLRRLVWRGLNGLATLLDPLLISLYMTGAEQEGPFLSALGSCVAGQVADAWKQSVVVSIRGILSEHLRISPLENDPDPAGRRQVANQLVNLFEIDTQAAVPGLLAQLLPIYVKTPPDQLPDDLPPDLQKQFTGSLELTLNNELQGLAQTIQSEAGIETLVQRLLTAIGLDAKKLKDLCGGVGADEAYKNALSDFQTFLKESFNGFEAARSAQGGVYRDLLIARARQLVPAETRWALNDFSTALTEANWFARRVNAAVGGPFEQLVLNLPLYAQAALHAEERQYLGTKKALPADFDAACQALLADPKVGRYVPDHAPQPLPVQIAVDTIAQEGDDFARVYNGVSLIVRRDGSTWAHANLAMLRVPREEDAYTVWGPTLLPLQPVAVDGQHRLFVEYTGTPLASDAFVDTHLPQESHPLVPFFTHSDPDKNQFGPHERLPALYYGADYDIAGFTISKGGSLPKGVQKSTRETWMLADVIVLPDSKKPLFKTFPYRRTTAIGRTTIVEPNTSRIGADIPGVQALGRDFPRVGCTALAGKSAVLDLLRNTDGSGAFTLPQDGATVSIELRDLWWWNGPGKLTIGVWGADSVNPGDAADVELRFHFGAPFADKALRIDITGQADHKLVFTPSIDGTQGESTVVPDGKSLLNAESIWLRVRIEAGAEGVFFSLADPSATLRTEHSASRSGADGLLLMAPKGGGNEWQPQYQEPVRAVIGFPKMGMLDFDRWFSNPDLMVEAWGEEAPGDFLELLMSFYIGRHRSDGLAALLDALPDLAVERLLIELTPLDSLAERPSDAVSVPSKIVSQTIELSKLGPRWNGLKEDDLQRRLARLAVHHSAELILQGSDDPLSLQCVPQGGNATQEWRITANVPRGMVARLTVRPLVRKKFVEDIFIDRMRSLASELRGDDYVFEGTSMTIECMLGALAVVAKPKEIVPDWQDKIEATDEGERCAKVEKLVEQCVSVQWAAAQRSYDLIGKGPAPRDDADAAWRWRRLGNVDVQTQRWRFMGRPIYSWFEPKRHVRSGTLPAGSVIVPLDNSPEVLDFEAELFVDRDDQDVDTRTMRVGSGTSVLQAVPWEAASATWFRHRVTVRSRYAGALISGLRLRSAVRGWGDDTTHSTPAWIRVAVLADRTRLQLTRPQLRALMPLTVAPRVDSQTAVGSQTEVSPTPPVLAVLDERPFAHGGLADRIGAEIKTSLGYRMDEVLTVEDSRKEFGPDPRLSYRPTPEVLAWAVTLRAEGPVGLTFDTDSVRTPVFANAALTLQPLILSEADIAPAALEEHFLSVVLRRYLDPRWLADTADVCKRLPLKTAWWLESSGPVRYRYDREELDLCSVVASGKSWVVKVGSRYLDVAAEHSDAVVTVCQMARDAVSSIALLHVPLEPGRASLSIFAVPAGTAEIESGASSAPLMMASVDVLLWKASHLRLPEGVVARATSASPVTSMNWTRTGKHFDVLHAGKPDATALVPYATSRLAVRRSKDKYVFVDADEQRSTPLVFEPTSGRYPNPLYVHRHHALIATKMTGRPGEPIEVFGDIFRVFGRDFSLPAGTRAVRVMEFETPAVPLSYGVAGAGMFDTAHFDLLAIGRTGPRRLTGCDFFLRLLGQAAVKPFNSLTLALTVLHANTRQQFAFTLERPVMMPPDPPLRGIALTVTLQQGGPPKVGARALFCGGDVRTLGVGKLGWKGEPKPVPAESVAVAIELAIDAVAGMAGELWADVSMLSAPEPIPDLTRFSFDWLFTGEAGNRMPAAAAVAAGQLRGLFEAEARVVAVSPGVRVEGPAN